MTVEDVPIRRWYSENAAAFFCEVRFVMAYGHSGMEYCTHSTKQVVEGPQKGRRSFVLGPRWDGVYFTRNMWSQRIMLPEYYSCWLNEKINYARRYAKIHRNYITGRSN
jgi:hypothetical protein